MLWKDYIQTQLQGAFIPYMANNIQCTEESIKLFRGKFKNFFNKSIKTKE